MKKIILALTLILPLAWTAPAFGETEMEVAQAQQVMVNINEADAEMLADVLTGVGPAKAEAIVAYRDANGPFESIEDLAQVRGIGTATIENNRAVIEL